MSAYDDYMELAKQSAKAGQLTNALKALRAAQELDDNDKVRRRIQKMKDALEAEENDLSNSNEDTGFKVFYQAFIIETLNFKSSFYQNYWNIICKLDELFHIILYYTLPETPSRGGGV